MNKVDQNFLIGVTALGLAGLVALRVQDKPVSLLGLDAANTKKLITGITVLSAGILLVQSFSKANA